MVDVLVSTYHFSRSDALELSSLAVDLRVSQIVNAGVYGIHAVLPYGTITSAL